MSWIHLGLSHTSAVLVENLRSFTRYEARPDEHECDEVRVAFEGRRWDGVEGDARCMLGYCDTALEYVRLEITKCSESALPHHHAAFACAV